MPLQTVRQALEGKQLEVSFTMMAEAREYRETKAIEYAARRASEILGDNYIALFRLLRCQMPTAKPRANHTQYAEFFYNYPLF